ncbi:MAG: ABC transporter substrate-binding protein [Candidatus Onthomonas sp.]
MRKKIVILLALLCLTFSACADGAAEETPEKKELLVIGFSQTGSESDWRVANSESIKSVFTEENGYELIFNDAQQKQENQIRALHTFIQQQVDYIVFSPITENGWEDVLTEAKNAGIPVIVVDRKVDVEDDSLYTAYVGSDFQAESAAAVRWLQDYLDRQGRGEETLNIVELQGTPDCTAQLGRTVSLEAAVEENDNWNLVAQQNGEFTNAKAKEIVTALIEEGTEFNVLVCQNDNMAIGAMEALDAAGVSYGTRPGQVIILSFDAVRDGLEACLAGKIAFDAECNPLQGPYVAEIIETLEAGAVPPKERYVEETTFNFETITREKIESRVY